MQYLDEILQNNDYITGAETPGRPAGEHREREHESVRAIADGRRERRRLSGNR